MMSANRVEVFCAKISSRAVALSVALILSPAAWGQTVTPNQTEMIERLMQRIDQLEKRVQELEAGKAGPSPAAVLPSAVAQARPQDQSAAPQTAAAQTHDAHSHDAPPDASGGFPALHFSGFGDINFNASGQPGTHTGFNEGQFILHLSSALSSRVTYFGEISMTARTDAGTGSPAVTGFNVEVERSLIRYDHSDQLKVSFGRFHTPLGYWNTAFHHGSWLQTTASRPEMIQFGGSFIPVHFIGALAEGSVSAGGLNLNYNGGVGNGRSSVLSRGGDWGDINNNKALLAGAYIKPNWLYGFQVGTSIYRDKIDAIGRPESREWIQSAHIAWTRENPEIIGEFFNVRHTAPGSSRTTSSQAWYAQVGYRLPVADRWKPYFRYEHIHIPQADLVFRGAVASVYGSTAGIRYDISSYAAFKFEYRNTTRFGIRNYNGLYGQTSFTF